MEEEEQQAMEEDEEEEEDVEPVDREYLGLITRSDLDRVHRYLVRVGKELNRDNNGKPGNPFTL